MEHCSQIFGDQIISSLSFDEIERKCQSFDNFLFIDLDFAPCDKSLYFKADNIDFLKKENEEISWKRPTQFLPHETIAVFDGKIEPNDIKQGELGA